jgi:hypothetical protein
MHRPQRSNVASTHGRWWRAAALVLLVAALHVLVLMRAAPAARQSPRTAAIEVRQIVAAPKSEPAAVVEPLVAQVSPKPAPTARPSKPRPVREAPVAPDTRSSPVDMASEPAALPPTRIPRSTELVFALQHGAQNGEARLSWHADGERYALSLHATLPSGREIEQHSQGGFDAAGLAPQRLADRRRGRDVRAANFQREHGKITFSGPRWELPLEAGTQDRLSWLVQLVALVDAAGRELRDGTEWTMTVVGARGALSQWRFELRGQQRIEFEGQMFDAWWLVREPMHPYDVRVEVWLGSQQGHWPLRLRQTQIPGGEPLEWLLRQQASPEPGT